MYLISILPEGRVSKGTIGSLEHDAYFFFGLIFGGEHEDTKEMGTTMIVDRMSRFYSC